MKHFIDPPPPFASLNEWENFLRQMEAMEDKDADVEREINAAKERINAIRKRGG